MKQTMSGGGASPEGKILHAAGLEYIPAKQPDAAKTDVRTTADASSIPARYYRSLNIKYWLLALAAGAAAWGLAFLHFTR